MSGDAVVGRTEDFSADALAPSNGGPQPAPRPAEAPYNLEAAQENKRGEIAIRLLTMLAMVLAVTYLFVLIAFLVAWDGTHSVDIVATLAALKALMEPILTALIGLIGSVIGFYFGANSSKPGPKPNGG